MYVRFLVNIIISASSLFVIGCAHQPTNEFPENPPTGPKNIILMISDGIGFNGWLAADYYQGLAGQQSYQIMRPDGTLPRVYGLAHSALNLVDGNGELLPSQTNPNKASGVVEQGYDPASRWNRFENTLLNDFQPVGIYTSYTDSAAAGTALLSGNKTANGRINMNWDGTVQYQTIATIAIQQGLSAGTISSVQASHATPAAVISHNISRNNYAQIFNEMASSDLTVIMGAGHPEYDASGNMIPNQQQREYKFVGGERTYETMRNTKQINGFTFIDAKSDFESLADGSNLPERVIGIARSATTLQAERKQLEQIDSISGMELNPDVPDLATMSKGALNVLNQDDDGFFIMIEGGAVDWMGHENNMPRFIEEQIDFNKAVNAVIAWVEQNSSWDETLLIITSDHECGGIWGEGTWTNSVGGPAAIDRSKRALTEARYDPAFDTFNDYLAVQDRGKGNIPGYQFASANHTNDLVPLWVIGNGGKRFEDSSMNDSKAMELWGKHYNWNGDVIDNTVVFQVMYDAIMQK